MSIRDAKPREPDDAAFIRGGRRSLLSMLSGKTSREATIRPPTVVAFLATLVALQLWAERASDPDIWLPDPFRSIVIASCGLFAVAALSKRATIRIALVSISLALPLLVMAIEWRESSRSVSSGRLAPSPDRLLRYTYRPGARVTDSPPGSSAMIITPDGLWDLPHPVPRSQAVRRVVVLGDSVPNDPTVPFAHRFPHRLQELLGARAPTGQSADVVNVSCEGYNTLQEVQLYERVGRRYQPDVIVVAYVLNDPFLQNGAYRRLGNSYFAFRLAPLLSLARGHSTCAIFLPLDRSYGYELAVVNSLERLRLLAAQDGANVLVAPLPIVAPFDDTECLSQYDHIMATARSLGFAATRVVDAFRHEPFERYLKPDNRFDVTHPNAAGHERIASHLADAIAPMLWPSHR